MTGNWEWVADLNSSSYAVVMGGSGCDSLGVNNVVYPVGSRCCFR
jgi:hypothetical protein